MFGHHNMTFGDLGQLFDGPHATPKRMDSGPYFLNISSLNAGRLDLDQSDHVSEDDFLHWTRRVTPQENDLLFSYETRLGEAALMPGGVQACLGRRMALMRPNCEVVHPRFLLYYYLSPSFQQLIEQHTIHGATVNRIGLSTMGNWPISIPPLDEQRAIAEVLGALDDKIAANTKLAETSAEFARALYENALSEGASEVSLIDVTALLTRGVAPKYSEGDDSIVVLNQKCIRGQRVTLEPARKTVPTKVREDKLLQPNDVLVNSTGQGTLGRVARWTSEQQATADSHISIVRFDRQTVDPTCAGFAVLRMQQVITDMGEGSTGQTELSRAELGKLRISLPPEHRQAELGERLGHMNRMETELLGENLHLATTRDALLPQLMSGKLRVKDIENTMGEMV